MDSTTTGCDVLGCGREVIAHGMCWNHYQRARRGAPVFVYLRKSNGSRLVAAHFGPDVPPGWRPARRVPVPPSLEERFWARVQKDGPTMPHMSTPCWRWTGASLSGYGRIREGGRGSRDLRATHVSWRLAGRGEVPAGLMLCHRCDNPECCRPDHLFLGTLGDNMADMKAKGRAARGERSGVAKLSESAAREIWGRVWAGETMVDLAEEFGVSPACIQKLKERRSWVHVTGT